MRNVKNLSHTFICHTLCVFVDVYLYIHMHLDHMVHPAMMCFGKVENECKQIWCWPEAMQSRTYKLQTSFLTILAKVHYTRGYIPKWQQLH